MINKTRTSCIGCNLCRRSCYFLENNKINLRDLTNRPDLRYHCFMCGKCEDVCPKDLSGKEIVRLMRGENPEGLEEERAQRDPYPYENKAYKDSKDLIYFGCSFPAYYPKTSKKIIDLARDLGTDFSIECCLFTYEGLGGRVDHRSAEEEFLKKGVGRLIAICPNCYHHYKKTFKKIEVVSIYRYFLENKIGQPIKEPVEVYFPCSDRYKREIFKDLEPFFESSYIDKFKDINCCGLGGGALRNEPGAADFVKEKMEKAQAKNIYTYCASCSYQFDSYGLKNVKHLASEILGVHEEVSKQKLKNMEDFRDYSRDF